MKPITVITVLLLLCGCGVYTEQQNAALPEELSVPQTEEQDISALEVEVMPEVSPKAEAHPIEEESQTGDGVLDQEEPPKVVLAANEPDNTVLAFAALLEEEKQTFTAQPLPDGIVDLITDASWTEDSPVSLEELSYLQITYLDFDGETKLGEMIVNAQLAQEVLDIFQELYQAGYPIGGMQLIDYFQADDVLSMEANNTYAFCTRAIAGTERLSQHSWGVAIDVNPLQNPYVTAGTFYPQAGEGYLDRTSVQLGMVTQDDACYNAFVSRGWAWGGYWTNPDYQHFEKPVS